MMGPVGLLVAVAITNLLHEVKTRPPFVHDTTIGSGGQNGDVLESEREQHSPDPFRVALRLRGRHAYIKAHDGLAVVCKPA
jgi:hypothetical protein